MIHKKEFQLGSLSPTSDAHNGRFMVDAYERESDARNVNIFHRRSSRESVGSDRRGGALV